LVVPHGPDRNLDLAEIVHAGSSGEQAPVGGSATAASD
jgi:hypothetical protein